MSYHELSVAERATIQIGLLNKLSQHRIARLLNRSPFTISREIRRNRTVHGHYVTHEAQRFMSVRRQSCRPSTATSCSSWWLTCCENAFRPNRLPASCAPWSFPSSKTPTSAARLFTTPFMPSPRADGRLRRAATNVRPGGSRRAAGRGAWPSRTTPLGLQLPIAEQAVDPLDRLPGIGRARQ